MLFKVNYLIYIFLYIFFYNFVFFDEEKVVILNFFITIIFLIYVLSKELDSYFVEKRKFLFSNLLRFNTYLVNINLNFFNYLVFLGLICIFFFNYFSKIYLNKYVYLQNSIPAVFFLW